MVVNDDHIYLFIAVKLVSGGTNKCAENKMLNHGQLIMSN